MNQQINDNGHMKNNNAMWAQRFLKRNIMAGTALISMAACNNSPPPIQPPAALFPVDATSYPMRSRVAYDAFNAAAVPAAGELAALIIKIRDKIGPLKFALNVKDISFSIYPNPKDGSEVRCNIKGFDETILTSMGRFYDAGLAIHNLDNERAWAGSPAQAFDCTQAADTFAGELSAKVPFLKKGAIKIPVKAMIGKMMAQSLTFPLAPITDALQADVKQKFCNAFSEVKDREIGQIRPVSPLDIHCPAIECRFKPRNAEDNTAFIIVTVPDEKVIQELRNISPQTDIQKNFLDVSESCFTEQQKSYAIGRVEFRTKTKPDFHITIYNPEPLRRKGPVKQVKITDIQPDIPVIAR